MKTITELSNVLVNFILAGVVLRVIWTAFRMIFEDNGELKQIRNLIIVAVLAAAVFALKETILSYYLYLFFSLYF